MKNLRCLNIALKQLIRQMVAARNVLTVCSYHATSTRHDYQVRAVAKTLLRQEDIILNFLTQTGDK